MNKSNHKKITEEALRASGLCSNAIRFVANANQDSDHLSGPLSYAGQHFCGPAPTDRVIEVCNEFISDSLYTAAKLARRGNEAEVIDALYFLGRAFHCVQDFYAHSNWIALGNVTVWHGKSASALKFCGETPKLKKANNLPIYKKLIPSKSKMGLESYRRMKAPRRTEADDVSHPDMHLDFERSWADRVIVRYGVIGGGTAYKLAHELARIDTLDHWCIFCDLMERPDYDPRTQNGDMEWKLLMETSELPGQLKSRYSTDYNEEKCDKDLAAQNLRSINPFARKGDRQIQTSRQAFHYLVTPGQVYNHRAALQTLDDIFGPRSLVF